MSSVLEADPVQNVIAQGFKQAVPTAPDKSKEKVPLLHLLSRDEIMYNL